MFNQGDVQKQLRHNKIVITVIIIIIIIIINDIITSNTSLVVVVIIIVVVVLLLDQIANIKYINGYVTSDITQKLTALKESGEVIEPQLDSAYSPKVTVEEEMAKQRRDNLLKV